MKVLKINDQLTGGGAEEVFNLTYELLLKHSNFSIEKATYKNFVSNNLSNKIWEKGYQKNFKLLLNNINPDIIHLHNIFGTFSPSFLYFLKEAKQNYNFKIIHTLHDFSLFSPCPCLDCIKSLKSLNIFQCSYGSKYDIKKFGKFLRYISIPKEYLKIVDCLICPSQFMKEVAISHGVNESKLKVVLNPNKFENISINSNKKNRVVYFGRLSPEKNLFHLLTLFKSVQENKEINTSNLLFTLAGEGPLLNKLKNFSYDNNIHVDFTGKLDRAGIKELLAETKLTIFPSKIPENGPLGVIEAVSNGCYVIGNNEGGMAEYLDHFPSCSKINIDSTKEFTEKFKSYIELGQKNDSLIHQSILLLNNSFRSELYISKIINIYHEAGH